MSRNCAGIVGTSSLQDLVEGTFFFSMREEAGSWTIAAVAHCFHFADLLALLVHLLSVDYYPQSIPLKRIKEFSCHAAVMNTSTSHACSAFFYQKNREGG